MKTAFRASSIVVVVVRKSPALGFRTTVRMSEKLDKAGNTDIPSTRRDSSGVSRCSFMSMDAGFCGDETLAGEASSETGVGDSKEAGVTVLGTDEPGPAATAKHITFSQTSEAGDETEKNMIISSPSSLKSSLKGNFRGASRSDKTGANIAHGSKYSISWQDSIQPDAKVAQVIRVEQFKNPKKSMCCCCISARD